MEGIEAAHAIKLAYPQIGVVVLSQYADESYAFELFRDGTARLAYLLKGRIGELSRLVDALRAVSAGGSVVDPQVVEALVRGRARLRASAPARRGSRPALIAIIVTRLISAALAVPAFFLLRQQGSRLA